MELKNYNKEVKKLKEIQAIKNEEIKTLNDEEMKKVKTILQNNNIRYGLFIDLIDNICEVLNKYKGKKLGDKTKEKIQKEIETNFNNNIFVYLSANNEYNCDSIYITTRDEEKKYSGNTKIRINTKSINNNFVNKNNEIMEVNKEQFTEEVARTYTKNIDETAKKIIKKHNEAKELQKKLNTLYHDINDLSNFKIKCILYTSTVSNFIV